jgi:broad specificity phosphatase PhoE
MPQPTRISLIRHALVHNPGDVFYGRLPRFGLGPEGQAQAEAMARALHDDPPDALYSSPLLRARQTAAAIIRLYPHLRLRLSALLLEVHSPLEGQPLAGLRARDFDLYTGIEAQYEQPVDLLRRVQKFMAMARRTYPGRHIAAVTHGDLVTFTVLWANGLQARADNKREVLRAGVVGGYPAPASICTFTYRGAEPDEMPGFRYTKPY